MAVDDVIVRAGPVAVPLDYKVPTGTEIIPRAVSASFDGTSAAGAFVPVLEVIAPNGSVTAYCARRVEYAAGASVLVSWFPGVAEADDTSSSSTPAGTVSTIASPGGTIAVTAPAGPTTSIDLPSSGAAAGTYGDATHTAQVQVNAQGVVTSAAQVGISGLAGSGLVKLFESILGAAAASIDTGANAIPSGHGDLIIVLIARSAGAASGFTVNMTFNGDAGANYNDVWNRVSQTGSGQKVTDFGANAAGVGQLPGGSTAANYAGVSRITIPGYDLTTFFKQGEFVMGYGGSAAAYDANAGIFSWASTAAINQITVAIGGGSNFVAGSRLAIFGTQ